MSSQTILKMLEQGETVVAPGAYDPLLAKLVQILGFRAVYMGGNMTGAHLLTSEPLTTLTEQVWSASIVVKSVDIPLIVDAGAGFGDALHTMRCVREFEYAGVEAIHIEDQVFPKRVSYHRGVEHIIPLDQFLEKISFALKARKDRGFLIIGRTDAFRVKGAGLKEAIRRGIALKELGVDVILPIGLQGKDVMKQFRKAVPDIPLMTVAELSGFTVQDFTDLGYQLIVYSAAPQIATVRAVHEFYTNLANHGALPLRQDEIQNWRLYIDDLIGLPGYYNVEAQTTEKG